MADDTKNGRSDEGLWVRIKKVGGTFVWFATLVGSAVTIIQAFPVLTATTRSIIEATFYPSPTNLALFVSDNRPLATQYLDILAERGFETRFVPLRKLNDVAKSERPGVLLVHKNEHRISEKVPLDGAARDRLRERTKVIGVGNFGAYFIRELDSTSMLGGVMHIHHTTATLDDPVKPEDIGQGLPLDKEIKLYDQETVDAMLTAAAFDEGSTAMQRARGVARVTGGQDPCKGAHWTIALQGNFALWGYGLPATQLTAEGRQIFGDLAIHMRETPYVQIERDFPKTEPGTLEDQLGCGSTIRTYRFRPTEPGLIRAKVSAHKRVALTLNAPFQVNAIARQDDVRPQVTFEVQRKDLVEPGDWSVRITYFGSVRPDTNIPYRLEIDYPYSKDQPVYWLIAAGIAFVIGILASVRLAVIFLRRRRSAG